MARAREGEERGKGAPLDDVQRVARHYGITIEEACDLLAVYSVEDLLPERGYGLTLSADVTPGQIIGYTTDDLTVALDAMEQTVPDGGKVKLELYTDRIPTEEALAESFLKMTAAGIHVSYPVAQRVEGVPITTIELKKGSPAFAAVVPLIVPVLTIGLIFFVVTKIETVAKAILPILILGVAGIVVLAGIARTERLGTKYIGRMAQTERRYGAPRSEEERQERHKRLYPSEAVPERGSGQKKALAAK